MAELRAPTSHDSDGFGPRTVERAREEATLAELARAGNRDAFGQLYVRYADYVRGYVGARVLDQSVVEDVANTAWLGAWKSLKTRSEPLRGEFREWLTGITRNKVANSFAEAKRHGHRSLDELHEAAHGGQLPDVEPADPTARVEERGLARAELGRVAERLRSMPANERSVFLSAVRDRYHAVEPLVRAEAAARRWSATTVRERADFGVVRDRVMRGEISGTRAAAELGVPNATFRRALAKDRAGAEHIGVAGQPASSSPAVMAPVSGGRQAARLDGRGVAAAEVRPAVMAGMAAGVTQRAGLELAR